MHRIHECYELLEQAKRYAEWFQERLEKGKLSEAWGMLAGGLLPTVNKILTVCGEDIIGSRYMNSVKRLHQELKEIEEELHKALRMFNDAMARWYSPTRAGKARILESISRVVEREIEREQEQKWMYSYGL